MWYCDWHAVYLRAAFVGIGDGFVGKSSEGKPVCSSFHYRHSHSTKLNYRSDDCFCDWFDGLSH